MTVRIPVKYDGTDIVELSTAERTEWYEYIAYLYAKSPTVTVSVVSSSGTLTPSGMTDTRMAAGSTSTNASARVAASDRLTMSSPRLWKADGKVGW